MSTLTRCVALLLVATNAVAAQPNLSGVWLPNSKESGRWPEAPAGTGTMARKYFGTDGIRGLATKVITPELALKVGQAAGVLLWRPGVEPRDGGYAQLDGVPPYELGNMDSSGSSGS